MRRTVFRIVTLYCLTFNLNAQEKPEAIVEKVFIEYQGDTVKARKLTVRSTIPISIDTAWRNVKSPELLKFVAKGMISFKSAEGEFPKNWQMGKKYGAKMKVFGFLPFGGTHYLYIESIDNRDHIIRTKEWDKQAKVWNHTVRMKDLGDGTILYEDEIIIYGGSMTGFITGFAKRFYKHRQKRWQIVANDRMTFGF